MSTQTLQKTNNDERIVNTLFNQIEEIIVNNKSKMAYQINNTLVNTYFNIGKIIIENEQNGNIRAEYNRYKNCQPLAGKLSWSHYCYLIYIEDDDERSFYEKECINSK